MPTNEEYQLLGQVIERSVHDPGFREQLLADPWGVLEDSGISMAGLNVIVHEYDENDLVVLLPPALPPPVVVPEIPSNRPYQYADQPQSKAMSGLAASALADPTDDRVMLGTYAPGAVGGGA